MKHLIAAILTVSSLCAQTPSKPIRHPKLHKFGHKIARDLKEAAEVGAALAIGTLYLYSRGSH
jgi:hypothetical protein